MQEEQDLTASIIIENKNNVWVKDNLVHNCTDCKIVFGYLYPKKHHCRNCGNIFCHSCSNHFVIIPEFMSDRPNAEDIWNLSYHITYLKTEKERVCKKCNDMINEKKYFHNAILKLLNDPQNIEEMYELSDSNYNIVNYYLDYLRNIQYYLPNHMYNDFDRNILLVNSKYLCGHSKYIVNLIKSINWNKNEEYKNNMAEFIIKIIDGTKIYKCTKLCCTRTCEEKISCDDCINILYSCHNTIHNKIIEYIYEIFNITSVDVIICNMTFFSHISIKTKNPIIIKLTFLLMSKNKKLLYHIYWFLNNHKKSMIQKKQENTNELKNINMFIGMIKPEKNKIMKTEYDFFYGISNNMDNIKKYMEYNFNKIKPIHLPYDPKIKLLSVNIDTIITKESHTKPIIVSFESTDGPIKILFKKDSIMNDFIVLNIMTLCDIILSENLDNNFDVVTYQTMPLSESFGMIEIIQESETIYDIKKKNNSILQHIIIKNDYSGRQISDVLNRYMYSLISYTLHSYFIGVGDRHPQNIMITDDGAIFHIDFGYILGKDTFPITGGDIRLNSDMLDVIGGTDSIRCKKYLDLCSKGVILLRKYFNIFFILLSLDTKFKSEDVEKFIISRFQPRQNDTSIINSLLVIIKESNNAFGDLIRDTLHYTTHDTLPNTISQVFKTACNIIKNITNSNVQNNKNTDN